MAKGDKEDGYPSFNWDRRVVWRAPEWHISMVSHDLCLIESYGGLDSGLDYELGSSAGRRSMGTMSSNAVNMGTRKHSSMGGGKT
jgi:hypothetical protein